MRLINKVLSRDEFKERPPVLMDIGAAGEILPKWRQLAPYSICIAFDADDREMGYALKESSGYAKLYVYNCIVSAEEAPEQTFYLTQSPLCSSLLPPQNEALSRYEFAQLFQVEREVRLKTVTIPRVLQELGIEKIDWFKTDSQGTDLRLFKSLGDAGMSRVLAAEFEPGIIDAYQGEDKLWSLLAFMEGKPFWMSDILIKGTQRFNRNLLAGELNVAQRRLVRSSGKIAPGWGEVSYLNCFSPDAAELEKRDYLLGWVFATIQKQYAFALEVALAGDARYGDPIFTELKRKSSSQITASLLSLPAALLTAKLRTLATKVGLP